MDSFNDFQNYEELFQSMNYPTIVQLCRTDQRFRAVCNSPRGKQLISKVLDEYVDVFVNRPDSFEYNIGDLLDTEIRYRTPPKLGGKNLYRLINEYEDIFMDVMIKLLIRNNYPPSIYQQMLQYIDKVNLRRSKLPIDKIETRYDPTINNFINTLYRARYKIGNYVMKVLPYLDPNTRMIDGQVYSDTDREFLRRHPELVSYFMEIYGKNK